MKNLHLVVPHPDDPKQDHKYEWSGPALVSAETTEKILGQIQHKIDAGVTWIYVHRRPFQTFEPKIIGRAHVERIDHEAHKVYLRDWQPLNARPSDLTIMSGAYLAKE
jgi:hypothetical protein